MESTEAWRPGRQIWYPQISDLAISPDGRAVVAAIREPLLTERRSEFITHLYLIQADGGETIQLTFGKYAERAPRWSPDGRFIAFIHDGPLARNLHAMRVDGGAAWALTDHEDTDVETFRWAPEGTRLAYTMAEPPSDDKRAARQAKDDAILWDVDLDFIHLFCVPFEVGPRECPTSRQLTTGRFTIIDFDWLPDGERLALTHRPTTRANDWPKTRLALLTRTGGKEDVPRGVDDLQDLGSIHARGEGPKISPDGTWIACDTGEEEPPQWPMANRIHLYSTEGGPSRALAALPDGQGWVQGWSANGDSVIALSYSGIDSEIWEVPVSGAAPRPLTRSASYKGCIATARNGHIAYSAETLAERAAVHHGDPTSGKQTLLYRPTPPTPWPDLDPPSSEVIRWQSVDGPEIEGIVSYPLGYEPGRRYPLVLAVHGGPGGVFSRRYVGIPQRYCNVAALAARGFVILQANPRGSSGYGKPFRFANIGDWGRGDYQDLMGGVDELILHGVADPERMGIMGWSYGGYMTSWVIAQTDRFRAACVGAGVTNLISFTGTADIPSFVPDYFGIEMWEDTDRYLQHSALGHVASIRTPTLIQHGQEDKRVPLGQGQELYNALKRQGVPVEMVIYPRQGHGISEPRLLADMQRRAIAWLQRWVLGAEDGEEEPDMGTETADRGKT